MYRKMLIKNNRPGTSLKASGIVLHETANPGATAKNHFDYWNKQHRGSSCHLVVDWNEAIQLIPYNEVSWHAGKTANETFIGVEMCRPKKHDESKFNKVWDLSVKLFAEIFIEQLGLTVVTKENLMSHDEVSKKWKETNHTDPVGYFAEYGRTVDGFRNAVQDKINELSKPKPMPLEDAVMVLEVNGIINSPDYWINNAIKGKTVKGEYISFLIQRMAEKLK